MALLAGGLREDGPFPQRTHPCLAFALLFALSSHCLPRPRGFITRLLNKPVPGGVAVIELGNGPSAPQARYQGKPTLVVREDGERWIAIVGIPLSAKAGPQQLEVDGRSTSFQVGNRDYRAQHITLKNQRQVNPNPADLKRIERELDEQNRAYRQFSTRQPSNLLFDRPVDGPLSSPFGLRRFFNGEERNPHSAWISPPRPARRSRRRRPARSYSPATISSTARPCSSTTVRGSSACSVTCPKSA